MHPLLLIFSWYNLTPVVTVQYIVTILSESSLACVITSIHHREFAQTKTYYNVDCCCYGESSWHVNAFCITDCAWWTPQRTSDWCLDVFFLLCGEPHITIYPIWESIVVTLLWEMLWCVLQILYVWEVHNRQCLIQPLLQVMRMEKHTFIMLYARTTWSLSIGKYYR